MLPKKLNICGHDIEVRHIKRFVGTRRNTYGRSNHPKDRIIIAKSDKWKNKLSRDWQMGTFLHEILHQIDDKKDARLRENQINKMSDGLYQTLKDNKLRFY
jgi:hypothetical protein